MRLRSSVALLWFGASPLFGQSWAVDEGTFVVMKGPASGLTESFKIKRGPDGAITATGNQTSGTQVITSSLTTDSLGTPIQYELRERKQGGLTMRVRASSGPRGAPRRMTAFSSASGGEESMREYPVSAGHTVLFEPGLLHQFFFLPLGGRSGRIQVVEPGAARSSTVVLTAKGPDNITVAGRSVTASRFSVTGLAVDGDFWIDSQGRLMRVDIPSRGLSATREEAPR
jgi:hypothetical protein